MNAFGKIIGILIAVVLLFVWPMQYVLQKQDILMQQYITTETSYFIDSIRNLGYVTKQMYEEYMRKIEMGNNLYEVELTHYHMRFYNKAEAEHDNSNVEMNYLGEEDMCRRYLCYYTAEILEELYSEECGYIYKMNQEDYITVKVKSKNKTLGSQMQEFLLGTDYSDRNYVSIYGGLIRDEAY